MYYKPYLICLFLLSVFSLNAQLDSRSIEVQFDKEKYDFYYSISMVRDSLEDTILIYNETQNKILQVTEFIRSRDMTYINIGNNQFEGTFTGFIDIKHQKTLTVKYKKISPLNLITADRTFCYQIDGSNKVIVPVQFNIDPDEASFDSKYLSLFEKGKSCFVDYFNVNFNAEKFSIDPSINKVKAGTYSGNVIFRSNGKELKQPIEVNIKHSFLTAMIAFLLSFAFSYVIRYFSINEEKINAYVKAKNLLESVQKDDQIDPVKKGDLLNQIESHIAEIDAWLHQAPYYENKFNELVKAYNAIKRTINLLAVDTADFATPISKLEKLRHGVKFSHTLITLLLCLVAFNTIYFNDPIFGSNIILDYLKLFTAVLVIVMASKGFIKERINGLNFTKG